MKKQLYGCLCAFLYVLLSAGQSVYAGSMTQQFSPFALSFFCFGIVSVMTLSMSLITKKLSLQILRENAMNYVMVNITTAVLWMGFLISVKYIEPALAVIIFGVVGPAMIALVTPWIRPQSVILVSEKYSSLVYLMIFAAIIVAVFDHKTAMPSHSLLYSLIGIVCAVLASLGTASLSIYAKKLFDKNLTVMQVLPFRFFILMLIVAPWLTPHDWQQMANHHSQLVVLIFALVGCLLPMYIGQLSMTLIEPITFSFIAATESLFALALQFFDKRLHVSMYSTSLVILTSVISIYVVIARLRHEKSHEKNDDAQLVLVSNT